MQPQIHSILTAINHSHLPIEASFNPNALVPQPQNIAIYNDAPEVVIERDISLFTSNNNPIIINRLKEKASELGIKLKHSSESSKMDLHLEINPEKIAHQQGYLLNISEKKIEITAHDEYGLHYGINTLLQIIELCPKTSYGFLVPQLDIADWPDFENRGILLDISRDRVPTMETLKGIVDKLAQWKINQIQLYMEHTFAYKGHEKIWKNASPLTPEDVQKLDDYCRKNFIELVPNQNSLAHMHRWLMHDDYKKYAETPSQVSKKKIAEELYEHEGNPGYSLCPTNPETLKLINGLYDQLFPNFSSRQINVGLDEPNDLSAGGEKSVAIIKKEGLSKVYLDYLNNIRKLVKDHGEDRVMQFWADFILLDDEIIDNLPSDVVPMVWGYENGFPFELGKSFSKRNIKWYVCPSTSTWSSFEGRTSDAINNLTQAAIKGKENGATGYLVTDWGDNGHHHPLSVSYLGFLLGASLGWKAVPREHLDQLDVPNLLNLHVFKDLTRQMGEIAYKIGDLYRLAVKDENKLTGCSALLRLLVFNGDYPDKTVINQLSQDGLKRIRDILIETKNKMQSVKMIGSESKIVFEEYSLVLNLLEFSDSFGQTLLNNPDVKKISKLPKQIKGKLKNQLKNILSQYKQVWLLRDQKGGLKESLNRIEHLYTLLS